MNSSALDLGTADLAKPHEPAKAQLLMTGHKI